MVQQAEAESLTALDPGAVSVVIPAYNEERALPEVLDALRAFSERLEVIVVDDGSSDRTAELANARPGVRLIRHDRNRGYGAALKTGVRAAEREWVLTIDADGTYPVRHLEEMLAAAGRGAEMVVGARIGASVAVPWVRRPAKWFLRRYAEYLVERRIADLNSGLRLVKRDILVRLLPILPNGFSFSTTLTLVMLKMEHRLADVPIDYLPRRGPSKIRPLRDTLNFLVLITRTAALFNPLRVFLPLSGLLFALAAVVLGIDIFVRRNISDSSTLLFIGALQIALLGILADLISVRDRLR
jgi:glycosyltransferase involved in cell wall biosynthesis